MLFCALKYFCVVIMNRFYLMMTSVAVFAFASCGSGEKDLRQVSSKVKVEVQSVGDASASGMQYSGTIEEGSGAALSFPVSGTVTGIYVATGSHVRKGQLLAKLDASSMRNMYDAARATLDQAEDARQRMEKLYSKGSLPEMQWVEVESKLKQARSAEAVAAKNLRDCNLYAPFSGVVAEKTADEGQNVMPGMPVLKLVTSGTLKVSVPVPENEIAGVTEGCRAVVTVPALGDRRFDATVVEKGIMAHQLSRSYEVKLRIDGRDTDLMPGMVAEVTLVKKGTSDAVPVIPARVVQTDEHNRTFVWTVSNGKAMRRNVTCGAYRADGVEIVSGLIAGDRIIVEGHEKVCDGTPVTF